MVTEQEKSNWEIYNKKYDSLFESGITNGLIGAYDSKLIENLRHIYYGGLPLSILLLCERFCNGFWYDRVPLLTLGFDKSDDFKVVYADVNSLRLNPENIDEYRKGQAGEHYANHCFAERTFSSGKTIVYDTSLGLVFDKDIYYQLESPKITNANDKEKTFSFLYHDFLQDQNIENDKYILPFVLPTIERDLLPVQSFYLEQLEQENAILKKEIGYEDICKRMHRNVKIKKNIK